LGQYNLFENNKAAGNGDKPEPAAVFINDY
jgi:hypothetical protein